MEEYHGQMEEALARQAEAQTRTEVALQELARRCETLVCDIEEISIFGRATDPARPERMLWIVGEAKHNLTLQEVEPIAQQVERARQHLTGEVYAVCFAYRARPEVRARLQELRIPLLFSYGRLA